MWTLTRLYKTALYIRIYKVWGTLHEKKRSYLSRWNLSECTSSGRFCRIDHRHRVSSEHTVTRAPCKIKNAIRFISPLAPSITWTIIINIKRDIARLSWFDSTFPYTTYNVKHSNTDYQFPILLTDISVIIIMVMAHCTVYAKAKDLIVEMGLYNYWKALKDFVTDPSLPSRFVTSLRRR